MASPSFKKDITVSIYICFDKETCDMLFNARQVFWNKAIYPVLNTYVVQDYCSFIFLINVYVLHVLVHVTKLLRLSLPDFHCSQILLNF